MDYNGLISDGALKSQGVDEVNRCSVPASVHEHIDGCKLLFVFGKSPVLMTRFIGLEALPVRPS
jgi:hypothetical protein